MSKKIVYIASIILGIIASYVSKAMFEDLSYTLAIISGILMAATAGFLIQKFIMK